ncbi:unnamed protein product [Haemonchus placei]|uniref:Uncharacterized protein n=1 Tax=Haemonchus placei TaxID=6290 RepID=A0A3P7Y9N5_HAEPC|nr:unnamed protein product [Haemonchus placei]
MSGRRSFGAALRSHFANGAHGLQLPPIQRNLCVYQLVQIVLFFWITDTGKICSLRTFVDFRLFVCRFKSCMSSIYPAFIGEIFLISYRVITCFITDEALLREVGHWKLNKTYILLRTVVSVMLELETEVFLAKSCSTVRFINIRSPSIFAILEISHHNVPPYSNFDRNILHLEFFMNFL